MQALHTQQSAFVPGESPFAYLTKPAVPAKAAHWAIVSVEPPLPSVLPFLLLLLHHVLAVVVHVGVGMKSVIPV